MITDEQHREMGRILGYPSCCVEQWISDRGQGGGAWTQRGLIVVCNRTREESFELELKIMKLLGRPWYFAGDDRMAYIPCDKHMIEPAADTYLGAQEAA